MDKWVSVRTGLPNSEIPCLVLQRVDGMITVYPKFVEFDGTDWVDIDGEKIDGVIAWCKAPAYDNGIERAVQIFTGCVEHDSCEKVDCCYFAKQKEIKALLEYIDF